MAAEPPRRGRHKTGRPLLSAREVRFCRFYAEHDNGYRAYTQAGFPEKDTRGATDMAVLRLVRRREIRECIQELRQAAADAARATVELVAQGLARTAFADRRKLYDAHGRLLPPDRWPDDVAATVERVESEDVFEWVEDGGKKRKELRGYVRKVWTGKRTEAQRVLAQWLRMVGDDKADAGPPPAPLVVGGEADPESL